MPQKPRHGLPGEHAPGGTSIDADRSGVVGLEQLPVHRSHILTGSGEVILRGFAIVEADDPYLPQCRNRQGFKLRAGGPAAGKPAAVQVDQHPVLVARADPLLGRIDIGMHAADVSVFPIHGVELMLACQIAGEQRRDAILLDQHFGTLNLKQVIAQIRLALRAQETGDRDGRGRNMDSSVRVHEHRIGGRRLLRTGRAAHQHCTQQHTGVQVPQDAITKGLGGHQRLPG